MEHTGLLLTDHHFLMVFIRTNTRVTFSNENIQSSVATFQVGPERDRPYVEFISTYLYQVDEVGGTISLVFGNDGEMVDGEVAFTAENLPDGQYYFSTLVLLTILLEMLESLKLGILMREADSSI